jgi:hypothetical protein
LGAEHWPVVQADAVRLGGKRVAELEQGADSIQIPDSEQVPAPALDLELATTVFDRDDLIQRYGHRAGRVGQEEMQTTELQLPRMARPIALLPPDCIAALTHGSKNGTWPRESHPQPFVATLRQTRTTLGASHGWRWSCAPEH